MFSFSAGGRKTVEKVRQTHKEIVEEVILTFESKKNHTLKHMLPL
jgi:hypothetical protein